MGLLFSVILFICFILRDFMVVPSKQNILAASEMVVTLANFISSSLEICWEFAPSCSKAFCIFFCFVLFSDVLIILQYATSEGVFSNRLKKVNQIFVHPLSNFFKPLTNGRAHIDNEKDKSNCYT